MDPEALRISLKIIHSYQNLILLCRNCHRKVDSDLSQYTKKLLEEIKASHELYISKSFTCKNDEFKISPFRVDLISTGKDVCDLIDGAHGYTFDIDADITRESSTQTADIFQIIKDCIDIWGDLSEELKISARFDFDDQFKALKLGNVLLYGTQRRLILQNDHGKFPFSATYIIARHTGIFQLEEGTASPEHLLIATKTPATLS